MQHIYSVMPLLKDHLDELAADAIDQYKRGITSCPLFIMYLQPEGNPVWDKAEQPCRNYAYVRDILKKKSQKKHIIKVLYVRHNGVEQ